MRQDCAELERGAGTILALAIVFIAITFAALALSIGVRMLENSRVSKQTDSIALAAADALRGVSTGYPCIVAKDMAEMNGLELRLCRIVGFEVLIETSKNDPLGEIISRARAGSGS